MKIHSRRVAAALLVAFISLSPLSAAAPRDRGSRDRDISDKIVRIIKHVQKLFGVSSNDDLPLPPPPRP